jgi:hypothetical protein
MILYWVSAAVLGGLFYFSKNGRRATVPPKNRPAAPKTVDLSSMKESEDGMIPPPTNEPESLDEEFTGVETYQTPSEEKTASEDQAAAPSGPEAKPAAAESQARQDGLEKAIAVGDAAAMIAVLDETDDPLQRDTLFNHILAIYYRRRSEAADREKFYAYGYRHLEEMPAILAALEQTEKRRPTRVATFKMIAIALEEDQRFEEAVTISKQAMALGFKDGTRTGYEGRIARLRKKQTQRLD